MFRFGFSEQAVNTIYALSEHPDTLCGEIVKKLASRIFDIPHPKEAVVADVDACAEALEANLTIDDDDSSESLVRSSNPLQCGAFDLAKLSFIVGHVAIKQIVHLELIESEWKRRKAQGNE